MEDLKQETNTTGANDKEIVFSKSIKAGKRIYYLDVKKNRKDELFLAITESKKVMINGDNDPHVSFEKHKIFLYKEDFDKFLDNLKQAIEFINANQIATNVESQPQNTHNVLKGKDYQENIEDDGTINIDIEF